MLNTGITRPVDQLGRIVIPKEIRKKLNLKEKDRLMFFLTDAPEGKRDIILRRIINSCNFCGSKNNLHEFKNKHVCYDCLNELKNMP